MVLLSPRHKHPIGTLVIQLQVMAPPSRASLNFEDPRQMMENMHSKMVEAFDIKCLDGACSFASKHEISTVGRSERSGKLKMAFGVIDAASKVSFRNQFV